eukprot:681705-Prymnesium_polylepis.1
MLAARAPSSRGSDRWRSCPRAGPQRRQCRRLQSRLDEKLAPRGHVGRNEKAVEVARIWDALTARAAELPRPLTELGCQQRRRRLRHEAFVVKLEVTILTHPPVLVFLDDPL